MIEDVLLVDLAKICVKTCHILKTLTEGGDVNDLSGPNKKQIEDLGRCADSAQSSLLTMTSDIRTMRHIESVVRERANRTRDSRGYHPGPPTNVSSHGGQICGRH